MADTPESSHKVHDDDDDDDFKGGGREGIGRLVAFGILSLLIVAGITALVLYLVYRPSHPHFTVISLAIVSAFSNSTSPFNTITAALQPTLLVHNPNSRSKIRYDRLEMYITYHDAPITSPVLLPPLTQAKETSVVVSPVLGGPAVPVSTEVAGELGADQSFGVVPLRVIAVGRMRYEAGPFRGQWRSLYVRCSLVAGARTGLTGPVPLLAIPDFSVA